MRHLGAITILLGLSMSGQAFAAPGGVKAGELTCNVSSGFGFIFGSSRDLRCTFRSANRGGERYRGTVNKFGVDIGYTGAEFWSGPFSRPHPMSAPAL